MSKSIQFILVPAIVLTVLFGFQILSRNDAFTATYEFPAKSGTIVSPQASKGQSAGTSNKNNCLACHEGIEPIRDPQSGMMQAIYELAEKAGHPGYEHNVANLAVKGLEVHERLGTGIHKKYMVELKKVA